MTIGWKILAGLLLLAALVAGEQAYEHHIYQQGVDATNAKWEKREADIAAQVLEDTLTRDRETRRAVDSITANSQQEKARAQTTIDHLRADVRSGVVRLSIPVNPGSCGSPASPGAGSAEARANIVPAVADDLVGIVADGDAAVRDLNECVDKYNAVKRSSEGEIRSAISRSGGDSPMKAGP
jgi:hypothetical protein